jgi:hypothetical protein
MTSAKVNQAIIESVLDSLARVKYDPSRATPGFVRTGLFTDRVERMAADRAPFYILNSVKSKFPNGSKASKQEIQQFVRKEVWERSFIQARGVINLKLVVGKSPKQYVQEAREALKMLKALGMESYMIRMYEDQLKKGIGEE